MSRKYKFNDPEDLYFISFSVVNWIDLFIRKEYKDIMLDSWKYCQLNKGLELYAWCIKTSHIHMIIRGYENRPEHIVRDMKRYSAQILRETIMKYDRESRKGWILEMMQKAGKKLSP